ncbi:MAG: dTMP kinase, partial [Candidatus Micrarchaeota archaeon]|nr:dTMP kinase [Candidatus Micrarchaeota archaeon]
MGKYVVFEGQEGCGKSTQIELYYDAMRKSDEKCMLVKEPDYESSIGKFIKLELVNTKRPLDTTSLQLLFVASRFEQFAKVIIPKLKDGTTVISDRNWMSTAAHMFAFAPPPYADIEWISNIHSKLPLPDAIFYISVPPDVAVERIKKRGNALRRYDNLENLKVLEKAYDALSKKYKQIWHRINGNQEPDAVHREIMQVWELLKKVEWNN